MFKQYPVIRALRYSGTALLLAAGLDGLGQIVFPHLSAWQSHIAAPLLCSVVVFLLIFGSFCREQFGLSEKPDLSEGADEALRKLASIVECSEDAIIGKTMDGLITSWNRAAEKMYGYTAAEAIGRHLSFLLPPERQAETRALMERIGNGLPVECLETQRWTEPLF